MGILFIVPNLYVATLLYWHCSGSNKCQVLPFHCNALVKCLSTVKQNKTYIHVGTHKRMHKYLKSAIQRVLHSSQSCSISHSGKNETKKGNNTQLGQGLSPHTTTPKCPANKSYTKLTLRWKHWLKRKETLRVHQVMCWMCYIVENTA